MSSSKPVGRTGRTVGIRWMRLWRAGVLTAVTMLLVGCTREPVDAPIAFLAQADGYWQIWRIERSGDKPSRVGRMSEDVARLSWFPDGKSLLANLQDGRLLKVDAVSGNATPIKAPVAGILDAAISPDGRRIAYSISMGESADRNDIWTVDIDTGLTQKITAIPGLQHEPVWAPDGKTIYFLSGQGGQFHDIWRVDVVSRATKQLTVNQLYHFDIAVRDDGEMVYSSNRGGHYDLWHMPEKGEAEQLTDDAALDARPSWSADGRRIVFESTRGGASNLWIYNVPTKTIERLTDLPGGARMPVWAPAGGAR